jgi:hypothetical protein
VPDLHNGLRGHDAKTGKLLWERKGVLTPRLMPTIWRHEGRDYILSRTAYFIDVPGQKKNIDCTALHLIEPKSGSVIWSRKGLAYCYEPLPVYKDYVILNDFHDGIDKFDLARRLSEQCGHYAMRLTIRGPERAWGLPKAPQYEHHWGGDSKGRRSVLMSENSAYIILRDNRDGTTKFRMIRANLSDGKILWEQPFSSNAAAQPVALGNRIFAQNDACHAGSNAGLHMWTVTPQGLEWRGLFATPDIATAYETSMESPFVDGLYIVRQKKGIAAFDLRNKN